MTDPLLASFGQATQVAVLLREQFEAFERAGFTAAQAMKLLVIMWQTMNTKMLMQGES